MDHGRGTRPVIERDSILNVFLFDRLSEKVASTKSSRSVLLELNLLFGAETGFG